MASEVAAVAIHDQKLAGLALANGCHEAPVHRQHVEQSLRHVIDPAGQKDTVKGFSIIEGLHPVAMADLYALTFGSVGEVALGLASKPPVALDGHNKAREPRGKFFFL